MSAAAPPKSNAPMMAKETLLWKKAMSLLMRSRPPCWRIYQMLSAVLVASRSEHHTAACLSCKRCCYYRASKSSFMTRFLAVSPYFLLLVSPTHLLVDDTVSLTGKEAYQKVLRDFQ